MAFSFVASAHSISSDTCGKPTGTASGHLLVAFASVASTTIAVTPPTGWTEYTAAYGFDTGASTELRVFWKIAGGAEPTTYQFSNASAVYTDVGISAFSPGTGSWATTPTDGGATSNTTNVTAASGANLPAITTTAAGDLYIATITTPGSPTWAGGTGVSMADAGWDGNGTAYATIAAAGSSGTLNVKPSANQTGDSLMCAAAFKLTASGGAAVLAASGGGNAGATAALRTTSALAAAGSGNADGTALRLNATQPLAASGGGNSNATALRLILAHALAAGGDGHANGMSSLALTAALAATGDGHANASGALRLQAVLAALGGGNSGGVADLTTTVLGILFAAGGGNSNATASLSVGTQQLAAYGGGVATSPPADLRTLSLNKFYHGKCPFCRFGCLVCGGTTWL